MPEERELTHQPEPDQPGDLAYFVPKYAKKHWDSMGQTLGLMIDQVRGDRAQFDNSLDYWNGLYEMRIGERDWPWPNASTSFVPLVRSAVDSQYSRLLGTVFLPRLYTVHGEDADSTMYEHDLEQYYNDLFTEEGWIHQHADCLHFALRDGLAYMEILQVERTVRKSIQVQVPVLDEAGQPAMDEQGIPMTRPMTKHVEIADQSGAVLEAIEVRDLLLYPAWASSVDDAQAVFRKLYLDENDLDAMVAGGILDAEMVERALSYVQEGQNELQSDPQGTETYTASDLVNVNPGAIPMPSGVGKMIRGPINVWRVHTDMFDLDGDGICEENLFWFHDTSRIMLGYDRFQYMSGNRPFKKLSLLPRPGREFGYGIPELLRNSQEEVNALHNHRMDEGELRLSPPRYKTGNVRFKDDDRRWGPDAEVEVSKPDDYGIIPLPDLPPSTLEMEQQIMSMAESIIGSASTAPPQPGAGGKTKAAQQAAQQSANLSGIKADMMSSRLRVWVREVFRYVHALNLQYGPPVLNASVQDGYGQTKKIGVTREQYSLDYDLGVTGMGGPLDKEGRRQDMMLLMQMLMANPLIQGDIMRTWNLTRMVLETFDVPEVTSIIGTAEEAQAKGQQMASAAKTSHDEQMMLQLSQTAGQDTSKAEIAQKQQEMELEKKKHEQEMQQEQQKHQQGMQQDAQKAAMQPPPQPPGQQPGQQAGPPA